MSVSGVLVPLGFAALAVSSCTSAQSLAPEYRRFAWAKNSVQPVTPSAVSKQST